MILADTDHLTVLVRPGDARYPVLADRLARVADDETVGIAIVTAEEQLRGWLGLIARQREVVGQVMPYARLAELLDTLTDWPIVAFDDAAAEAFVRFRKLKVRIGSQDLKIASIAVTNDALLLSANANDFNRVPGLRVENWLR